MTTIINFFGAPGCGKSTTAARIFSEMKQVHTKCEIITEYAKDLVWEERFNVFNDQIYILGKQNRRLLRLLDKVDYVITDSPILLGICYMVDVPYAAPLERLIVEVFNSYNNINIFLNRTHPYQAYGRNHDEQESDTLSVQIKEVMNRYNIPFIEMNANEVNLKNISDLLVTSHK